MESEIDRREMFSISVSITDRCRYDNEQVSAHTDAVIDHCETLEIFDKYPPR